jgi:hypothetical protein
VALKGKWPQKRKPEGRHPALSHLQKRDIENGGQIPETGSASLIFLVECT